MTKPVAEAHQIETPIIMVLGDLMLDCYTWADADRISPEAPVIVLRAEREEVRLGGAASVASLLRALQADVVLAGVIGDDGPGRGVRKLLGDEGIDQEAVVVDSGRPTTSKERFMGRTANRAPHQILRVDREVRRPLDNGIETVLIDAVLRDLPRVDAVLISDYDKGTCTQELLGRVIESARHKNIPVFIDPARISDYSRYRHATLLTPNRVEAEIAFGRKIRTPADAIQAGEFLSQHWEVPDVLVKLDCDGMVLAGNSRIGQHFPTRSRRVQDVTGAGDMVLAIAGFCQPCGFSWDETIRLANVAAGLEVEKLGVAPVSWTEIRADSDLTEKSAAQCSRIVTLDEMIALADTYRRQGRTLVFTNGCFDLLHIGHVTYLQEAARLGDILVVAINSDESVRRLKGHDRPVVKEGDRAGLLAALSCVDHVLIFQEDTPQMLLRQIRPDVLVKGGTYSLNEVVGRDVVEQFGGRVVVVSHVDGVSTTKIVAELLSRNRLPPANV